MVKGALDISMDPDCSKIMDPNMALSCSSGLDITMELGSSAGYSDLHASWPLDTNLDSDQMGDLTLGILTALSGNKSHTCQSRPWLYRAMKLDMVLGSSLGLDDTMALGGSTGHSDLHGLCCGMAPRLQQSCRLWPRSQAFLWVLVATRATEFNTYLSWTQT
ncbi:hypothetical protein NN561_006056 [Cricetulus griseus]